MANEVYITVKIGEGWDEDSFFDLDDVFSNRQSARTRLKELVDEENDPDSSMELTWINEDSAIFKNRNRSIEFKVWAYEVKD